MKRNGNVAYSTTSQSGLRPPAPLVGEPLARRQSLQNAKASLTRRGVTAGDGEVVRRKAFRKPLSKTETCHVVQPLSHRLGMPAPLVGEPLARRRSLRNAKASPTRRGVTAGDGEVARRKACRKTVKQNGNVSCGTTSQSALTRCQLPWEERRHRR